MVMKLFDRFRQPPRLDLLKISTRLEQQVDQGNSRETSWLGWLILIIVLGVFIWTALTCRRCY